MDSWRRLPASHAAATGFASPAATPSLPPPDSEPGLSSIWIRPTAASSAIWATRVWRFRPWLRLYVNQQVFLRFDLANPRARVEATGRVAWADPVGQAGSRVSDSFAAFPALAERMDFHSTPELRRNTRPGIEFLHTAVTSRPGVVIFLRRRGPRSVLNPGAASARTDGRSAPARCICPGFRLPFRRPALRIWWMD